MSKAVASIHRFIHIMVAFLSVLTVVGVAPTATAQESPDVAEVRKQAEAEDAEAQYKLGGMYDNGSGVPRDAVEAVKWYRMAAEQGYCPAQSMLGSMYTLGRGVPKDDILAYSWFNLASSQGLAVAEAQRDSLAKSMTPEQIAEAQKISREFKPKSEKIYDPKQASLDQIRSLISPK